VTLRGEPLEQAVTLPDGREVVVRVGVAEDSYVPKRERNTVTVELLHDGRGLAAVDTVLDADQTSEARALLLELVAGLTAGTLLPTAAAIEPLADRLR
jgi:hypothetical protein